MNINTYWHMETMRVYMENRSRMIVSAIRMPSKYDHQRAGDIPHRLLDPELDREIIETLYPRWRLESDLAVLEPRLESLQELQAAYELRRPQLVKRSYRLEHAVEEEVKDYQRILAAIRRTNILINMARRGIAYYDGLAINEGEII